MMKYLLSSAALGLGLAASAVLRKSGKPREAERWALRFLAAACLLPIAAVAVGAALDGIGRFGPLAADLGAGFAAGPVRGPDAGPAAGSTIGRVAPDGIAAAASGRAAGVATAMRQRSPIARAADRIGVLVVATDAAVAPAVDAVCAAAAIFALAAFGARAFIDKRRKARGARRYEALALPGARWPVLFDPRDPCPRVEGFVAPRIFLPADAAAWPEARLRAVLAHEERHAERRDNLRRAFAAAAACVLAAHPLAWILAAVHRQAGEEDCDQAALGTGMSRAAYAEALVALARTMGPRRAAAFARERKGGLRSRVEALFRPRASRRRSRLATTAAAGAFAAALALGALAACAAPAGRQAAASRGKEAGPAYGTAAWNAQVYRGSVGREVGYGADFPFDLPVDLGADWTWTARDEKAMFGDTIRSFYFFSPRFPGYAWNEDLSNEMARYRERTAPAWDAVGNSIKERFLGSSSTDSWKSIRRFVQEFGPPDFISVETLIADPDNAEYLYHYGDVAISLMDDLSTVYQARVHEPTVEWSNVRVGHSTGPDLNSLSYNLPRPLKIVDCSPDPNNLLTWKDRVFYKNVLGPDSNLSIYVDRSRFIRLYVKDDRVVSLHVFG